MSRTTKTKLYQARISQPTDAIVEFSKATDREIPVVLVPDDRIAFSCFMTVPSGVFCVEHRFGKDIGEDQLAEPGLRCKPSWHRIAYCVTQQACTYNAPVVQCPTDDNVAVDCELTVVFTIGPEPAEIKRFVYTLGAARLDEFLAAAVDEAIRHLVRSCEHHEIYELRGGNDIRVVKTLQQLNKKFNRFGVHFMTAAITDVHFNAELQKTLQETTNFKSRINEQVKIHTHHVDKIRFEAKNEMEALLKANERTIQNMQAACTRAEIDRSKLLTDMASTAEVEITRARQEMEVRITRADAQVAVAAAEANRQAEEILATARAADKQQRIKAMEEAKASIYSSEQELLAAQDYAKALREEAEAEANAADGLQARREFDLRLLKIKVVEALSQSCKMVISGENGERLINALLDSSMFGPAPAGKK